MGKRAVLVLLLISSSALGEGTQKQDRLAESLMAEGDRFLQAKNPAAAISMFESARVLTGERPGPYLMLGLAYASADNCEKALPMIEKYLSLKKVDPRHEATTTLTACRISESARAQQKNEGEAQKRANNSELQHRLDRALTMMGEEKERARVFEQRLREAEGKNSPPPQLLNHQMVVRNIGHRVFIEWAVTFWINNEGKLAVRDFSFQKDNDGYIVEPGAVFDAGLGLATVMRVEQPGGNRSAEWYFTSNTPQLNQRW